MTASPFENIQYPKMFWFLLINSEIIEYYLIVQSLNEDHISDKTKTAVIVRLYNNS